VLRRRLSFAVREVDLLSTTIRRAFLAAGLPIVLATAFVSPTEAGSVQGVVKLGAISIDESGKDLTAMQETYNIYEGFSVSQIKLNGQVGQRSSFFLDLKEINQDSGKGLFTYRVQDLAKFTVKYGRHRQLYDADGSVSSERKDWRVGASVTPTDWSRVTADFGHQTRTGDRLGQPTGGNSVLGGNYDYTIINGKVAAEARHNSGRSFVVGWDFNAFDDDQFTAARRRGDVLSARLNGPCLLFPTKVTHFIRAAYGKQSLESFRLDQTMSNFQYLGMYKPNRALQFKYRFYAGQIKDDATTYQTDNIRNDFDAKLYHNYGQVFGGYGYVTNDDDLRLTENHAWRLGLSLHHQKLLRFRISYANSEKTDQEQRTLLKDIESSRLKVSLKSQLHDNLSVGMTYADRRREFPVIDVVADGKRVSVFSRVDANDLGAISLEYSYSEDSYDDRVAGFDVNNNALTGRIDFNRVKNLNLAAGITYLSISQDLDIEKTILMFEGDYTFADDYFIEVKYNVYNYDDYLIRDRYYSANVIWLNVGYKIAIN
jgi:hypothetical protein